MRSSLVLLLLVSIVILPGCSVFGIATRGDLEDERRASQARQERMREENRVLRERIAQLGGTLEATGGALSELESMLQGFERRAAEQRQEIWTRTGDLQLRMASIEDRLGAASSVSDSLRSDVLIARQAAQMASTEAQTVRRDLDDVSERAEIAQSRSEILLRAWLQQLRDERARLERQLSALEASLSQWESEVFETPQRLEAPDPESTDPAAPDETTPATLD